MHVHWHLLVLYSMVWRPSVANITDRFQLVQLAVPPLVPSRLAIPQKTVSFSASGCSL